MTNNHDHDVIPCRDDGDDTLYYLASPYNHPDPAVREERFRSACKVAGELVSRGLMVYSPIAHNHPIASTVNLPSGWDYWRRFDRAMLARCQVVYVLMLPGWSESVGVRAEIEIAVEFGLKIEFVRCTTSYNLGGDELLLPGIDPVFYDPDVARPNTGNSAVEMHDSVGGWCFWDETWAAFLGPYETESEARQALAEYAESL